MSYSAEDFEKARFARRGEFEFARRVDDTRMPWLAYQDGAADWASDAGMAVEGWVPVRETAPLSLDSLTAAYEAAEVADEYRAGDVLISLTRPWRLVITRAMTDGDGLRKHVRVLTRAPQREPWQDLADVLRNEVDMETDPDVVAETLHSLGWRKTGGEES